VFLSIRSCGNSFQSRIVLGKVIYNKAISISDLLLAMKIHIFRFLGVLQQQISLPVYLNSESVYNDSPKICQKYMY